MIMASRNGYFLTLESRVTYFREADSTTGVAFDDHFGGRCRWFSGILFFPLVKRVTDNMTTRGHGLTVGVWVSSTLSIMTIFFSEQLSWLVKAIGLLWWSQITDIPEYNYLGTECYIRSLCTGQTTPRLPIKYTSLVQRNIVVSPKIWKIGLLLIFDIKDKISRGNVL